MPIVFKKTEAEQQIIEKDGTRFIFETSEGKRRQARMNTYAGMKGDRDFGSLIEDMFRKSLTGWENLVDENGKQVDYSIVVRDALVRETDIFNDSDVLAVLGLGEDKKKVTAATKKGSTSKKP